MKLTLLTARRVMCEFPQSVSFTTTLKDEGTRRTQGNPWTRAA